MKKLRRSCMTAEKSCRIWLVALTAASAACHSKPVDPQPDSERAEPAEPPQPPAPSEPPVPPESPVARDPPIVEVGTMLVSTRVLNVETGREYCQICEYVGNPKIVAAGSLEDAEFHASLISLNKVIQDDPAKRARAFVVFISSSFADEQSFTKDALALKKRLGLQIPVVIPPLDGSGATLEWQSLYNISKSQTFILADEDGVVLDSGVGPKALARMSQALLTSPRGS